MAGLLGLPNTKLLNIPASMSTANSTMFQKLPDETFVACANPNPPGGQKDPMYPHKKVNTTPKTAISMRMTSYSPLNRLVLRGETA